MSEHELCAEQTAKTNLVLEAQRMVRFAAEPVKPGQSIGAQILKAAETLQLPHGVIWRAWYRRAGPEIYPTIHEAWGALLNATPENKRHAA